MLPGDQNDVTVGSFNWQSGPLGNFYLPANSPLIDAGANDDASSVVVVVNGATGATEPLSYFTTQTSQTLDSGLVDIGYHYGFWFPPPPNLGPMDVVFIIDNTYSLGNNDFFIAIQGAINNSFGLNTLDYIVSSSGNDYRLALVTPDNDQVNVRVNFSTNNRDIFENAVAVAVNDSFDNEYGYNTPESTDKCLETVARALTANQAVNNYGCTRPSNDPTTLQINDFYPSFRANARKMIVLITDAPPSGFCDSGADPYDTWYEGKAHYIAAQYAAPQQIKINAVMVQSNGDSFEAGARTVLKDYAQTTCGWYPPELSYYSNSFEVENSFVYMLYSASECGQ